MKKLLPILFAVALCAVPAFAQDDAQAHSASGTLITPQNAPQPTIKPLTQAKPDEAKASAPTAKLTGQDRETITRVEDYFNTIHTLQANFMQTLSDGSTTNGTLYIKRPGKMRLEYAPPNKDLLVADGLFVHAWDSQAHTSSSVPLGRSMADIILRDPLKLSGDITVKQVRYYPQMLEMDVVQTDDPAAGMITLEFQDNPLQFRNWRVTDAQGATTRVALANQQANQDIPSSTFAYHDPNFGR